MNWYDDKTRKTYVANYKDEKSMRSEVEAAARQGFVTQTMTRTGSAWTITYHRDERAWARVQVEQALQQLRTERAKLQQAVNKTAAMDSELEKRFRFARTQTSDPTQIEQKLLTAISNLTAARNSANIQRQVVIASFSSLVSTRDEAARLQVTVPGTNWDSEAETAALRTEISAENIRIQQDELLQQNQRAVVKVVREWQNVVGERWGAHTKLARLERASSRQQLQSPASVSTSTPTMSKVETERAKSSERLVTLERLLQQREVELLRELEARDKRMLEIHGWSSSGSVDSL